VVYLVGPNTGYQTNRKPAGALPLPDRRLMEVLPLL
jgi:hypothetical protein